MTEQEIQQIADAVVAKLGDEFAEKIANHIFTTMSQKEDAKIRERIRLAAESRPARIPG